MRILFLVSLLLIKSMTYADVLEYISPESPTETFGTAAIAVDLSQCHLIFVSLQVAINKETGERKEGSIQEATYQILENIQDIFKKAGTNFGYVVHMDISIKNIKDLEGMKEAFTKFFSHLPLPTLKVTQAAIDSRIAISCIAARPIAPCCEECANKQR